MREGWCDDDYLILFDESEISAVSDRYAISQFLPGHQILGLAGWDDFIVQNSSGQTYRLPTVPMDQRHLSPFPLVTIDKDALQPDARFSGKIKWYVQPLVFGGDPKAKDNIVWVTHDEHAQLVKWWNNKYRELRNS